MELRFHKPKTPNISACTSTSNLTGKNIYETQTLKLSKMYWLIDRNSQLSVENKILLDKTILKSIWIHRSKLVSNSGTQPQTPTFNTAKIRIKDPQDNQDNKLLMPPDTSQMTNAIVISYQLSKKLSRNSVKDIATEKQPNNLAATL